jgi:phosphate transport system protein
MEENILDMGSKLIITQQPVAKDLRRIIVGPFLYFWSANIQ